MSAMATVGKPPRTPSRASFLEYPAAIFAGPPLGWRSPGRGRGAWDFRSSSFHFHFSNFSIRPSLALNRNHTEPACLNRSRKYSFQLSGNAATRNARCTELVSACPNLLATYKRVISETGTPFAS
jgi:hypothetical protein